MKVAPKKKKKKRPSYAASYQNPLMLKTKQMQNYGSMDQTHIHKHS